MVLDQRAVNEIYESISKLIKNQIVSRTVELSEMPENKDVSKLVCKDVAILECLLAIEMCKIEADGIRINNTFDKAITTGKPSIVQTLNHCVGSIEEIKKQQLINVESAINKDESLNEQN